MVKADFEDTIAAVSTPVGEGGISIVRMSGPSSIAIADRIFASPEGKKPSGYRTYTVHYGKIVDGGKGVDEVILTVMKAPRSYTKEDVVEINCHGGLQAAKKVFDLVVRRGARVAEPGEFTKRAFLNGRIDLAQAEAVLDVIRARTEESLKTAMGQLEGGLSARVNAIRDRLIDMASHIEASIDFPDEDIGPADKKTLLKNADRAVRDLQELASTYDEGAILRDGVLAIICGKPNVGKSSLMNLLLKRDRVIVSPIPGTTRDAVEETINLKGIPIRLVDTAGIAETKDVLEKEGIARSKKYLALADIAIVVFDNSTALSAADRAIVRMVDGKKTVAIVNKCDLAGKIDMDKAASLTGGRRPVTVSVEKKKNIAALEKAIVDTIWKGGFSRGESCLVTNARHKALLDKALRNMLSVKRAVSTAFAPELVSIELKEAISALGLITGRTVSDDILDRIFEHFCIGK